MIGSLGFQEILLIMAVALLIFGPRELPKIGRTIGRTLAEFRKASNDLRRSLNSELLDEELRQNDPRKVVKETMADLKSLGRFDEAEAETAEPATTAGSTADAPAADAPAAVTDESGEPTAAEALAGSAGEAGTSDEAPEAEPAVPATVARASSPSSDAT